MSFLVLLANLAVFFKSLKPKRRPTPRRSFRLFKKSSSKSRSRNMLTFAVPVTLPLGDSAYSLTSAGSHEDRVTLVDELHSTYGDPPKGPGEKILEKFSPPENEGQHEPQQQSPAEQISHLGFKPLSPPPRWKQLAKNHSDKTSTADSQVPSSVCPFNLPKAPSEPPFLLHRQDQFETGSTKSGHISLKLSLFRWRHERH